MVGWIEEDDLLLFVPVMAEDSLAAAAPPPAPGANNIPNGALYGCWVRSIVTIPPSPPLRNDDADNILKNFGSDEWVAPRTHGTSRFADVATARKKRCTRGDRGFASFHKKCGGIVGGIV